MPTARLQQHLAVLQPGARWPESPCGLPSSTRTVPPSTNQHPQHYLERLKRNHGPAFEGNGDLDLKMAKGTSQNPRLRFFAGVSSNRGVVIPALGLTLLQSPHLQSDVHSLLTAYGKGQSLLRVCMSPDNPETPRSTGTLGCHKNKNDKESSMKH